MGWNRQFDFSFFEPLVSSDDKIDCWNIFPLEKKATQTQFNSGFITKVLVIRQIDNLANTYEYPAMPIIQLDNCFFQ